MAKKIKNILDLVRQFVKSYKILKNIVPCRVSFRVEVAKAGPHNKEVVAMDVEGMILYI